jgi:hypothetical protein
MRKCTVVHFLFWRKMYDWHDYLFTYLANLILFLRNHKYRNEAQTNNGKTQGHARIKIHVSQCRERHIRPNNACPSPFRGLFYISPQGSEHPTEQNNHDEFFQLQFFATMVFYWVEFRKNTGSSEPLESLVVANGLELFLGSNTGTDGMGNFLRV